MPRIGLALLVAGALALGRPHVTVYASDVNESPECQRMFQQLAEPLLQQLLWFTSMASQYPLTPQGRPVVTGWPYSAYGPGNGYGPASPYGPAFGPWGAGALAPGAGTPALFGGGRLARRAGLAICPHAVCHEPRRRERWPARPLLPLGGERDQCLRSGLPSGGRPGCAGHRRLDCAQRAAAGRGG